MNILLISPNTLTVPYPVYPIGLDYVAGSIPPSHRVRIVDCNVCSPEELEATVARFQPDIIGISCRNIDNTESGDSLFFIRELRDLVRRLRAICRAVIVCGGAGFTIMPEEIFSSLGADYGIIGEGERFGLLVEALAAGQNPAALPGVIDSPITVELPPPWEGKQQRAFFADAPHKEFYLNRGGMLNLQSKRGCSFSCIYCPYPRIEGHRHRLIAPEQVAATACQLEEAGARYLFLTDSAFNSDIHHSLAVARAFKRAGLSIPWGGFFAPVRLPPDYFKVMAECGLRHAEFGTESLCSSMLATYRKPFRVDDVFFAHRQARQAGIYTAHYFLLGGPGESEETVRESLDNIETLERAALFFFTGIRIYPGTRLHEIAIEEGKLDPDDPLLEPVFYRPDDIDNRRIEEMISKQAGGRMSWVVGSGGRQSAEIIARMHKRGHSGPLWELIAR